MVGRRGIARLVWAILVVGAVVLIVTQLGIVTSQPSVGLGSEQQFSWLVPSHAPSMWGHVDLPSGTAVLSYPPGFRSIHGDPGTVTEALVDPNGHYLAYLNATPRQGNERLDNWPEFRLDHQREDDAISVRKDAQSKIMAFRGGRGTCVIDDYITRVAQHPFREIACFVEGRHSASVVVAASPPSQWLRFGPKLEQAIAAYEVS